MATNAPSETLLYAVGLYMDTGVNEPDYLATTDVNPNSPTHSKVVHRLPMPYVGDELQRFG